jgi:NADPH:quinone reductase-like Zn-dependent oxidoreductase
VKAVVVHRSGGPDELRLEDVQDPEPGLGGVRIAVTAAGTNPVDASNRACRNHMLLPKDSRLDDETLRCRTIFRHCTDLPDHAV